jgi:ferritin-like metal-binding protein YciE
VCPTNRTTPASRGELRLSADDAVPNARDAKLIDWLDQARVNEARLQAELTTHVALIEKPAYKKRLQTHINETQEHERWVAQRIEQLGGETGGLVVPGVAPGVVSAVGGAAGRAMAAVRGQIAARTSAAEGAEAQLRIAQDQVREEHFEIALYTAIQAFAEEVGDSETAKLARAILRDEQRMAKFLADELPKLVRDVVLAEIPRDQRVTRRRRARSTSASVSPRSPSSPGSAADTSRSRPPS